MKIIFYSDSLEYGGAEKYLNDIVSGFCSEKNKLYVVCSTFKAFGEAEKKTGVEIIKIRPKSVFDFLSFLQLLIFFLKISPDIVFILPGPSTLHLMSPDIENKFIFFLATLSLPKLFIVVLNVLCVL